VKPAIRPAARDDILHQFRYYLVDQDKPEVAKRFLRAVQRTMEEIVRTPHGGAPKRLSQETLRGLRSWPVRGFDDVRIYYLEQENQVRVVRVLHGKRDINNILEKESDETLQ
jgi:toxin ParE1/3/4